MVVTAVSVSSEKSSVTWGSMDQPGSKRAQLTRKASMCQYRIPARIVLKNIMEEKLALAYAAPSCEVLVEAW